MTEGIKKRWRKYMSLNLTGMDSNVMKFHISFCLRNLDLLYAPIIEKLKYSLFLWLP